MVGPNAVMLAGALEGIGLRRRRNIPLEVNGLSGLVVSFSRSKSAPLICTFKALRHFFEDLGGDAGVISSVLKAVFSAGAEHAVLLESVIGEFSILKIVFCGGAESVIFGGAGNARFSMLSLVTIRSDASDAGLPRQ